MADSKEVVPVGDVYSPEFIQELLPCSQQISLLYHISYLCLASFPQLERLLRMRAVETQLLFGSSEAVLLKCVGTSQNLVKSLFPMLIAAVNKHKTSVAQSYLEKARNWIEDIINEVDKMVKRYDEHNRDVATTTSDIFTVKKETEKAKAQLTQQQQTIQDEIDKLKNDGEELKKKIDDIEKAIEDQSRQLLEHVKDVTSKKSGVGFVGVVPFIGALIQSIYNAVTEPGAVQKTKAFEIEINKFTAEKNSLKEEKWKKQVMEIDMRMKLAKINIENGNIPDPVHLGEVQFFLSKVQEILIQLKGFWQKVYIMLGTIKDQTFVNESIFDDSDFKDMFLNSIEDASKAWKCFGEGCGRGAQIFRLQSKDAYKFLQIDPSTLEKEVWQKEYDSVKQQLQDLNVLGEKKTPAIEMGE